MKSKIISLILFLCLTLFTNNIVYSQSKIQINEFLIDPQPQQVEIYNNGADTVDISGWVIDDSGGATYFTIPQSSVLNPGYCLVFSGDINLNKTSADTVKLFKGDEIVDSFSYKSSSGSGISYYRLTDGGDTWTSGPSNLGFYNTGGGQSCLYPAAVTPLPEPTSTLFPSVTPTPYKPAEVFTETVAPLPTPISYGNIRLSEVMVYPVSGESEWLEIYNDNDFSVSLADWFIDDEENAGSSPRKISLEIPPKNYGVTVLSSSVFNNNGDSVRLLDSGKNLIDDFEYIYTLQGKTYGVSSVNSADFCLQDPSAGSINNSCLVSSVQPVISGSPAPAISLMPNDTALPAGRYMSLNKANLFITSRPAPVVKRTGRTSTQILGVSTNNNRPNFLLIKTFCFLSLAYSLLTIVSVLVKTTYFPINE